MGIADELERLAELHRRGDIDENEYLAAKRAVLNQAGAGSELSSGSQPGRRLQPPPLRYDSQPSDVAGDVGPPDRGRHGDDLHHDALDDRDLNGRFGTSDHHHDDLDEGDGWDADPSGPFRSSSRRTASPAGPQQAVGWSLSVYLVVLVGAASSINQVARNLTSISDDALVRLDQWMNGWMLANIAFGVVFVICLSRARATVPESQLRWSQGWLYGAWFIPIANLILPYLVVADLVKAVDRSRLARVRVWFLALVAMVLVNAAANTAPNADAAVTLLYSTLAAGGIAAAAATTVIFTFDGRQR